MTAIRTILCPVDFSPATDGQLALAIELCRAFGARLVLHHNLATTPPGAGIGWMYAEAHAGVPSEADGEKRLRELMAGVPEGIAVEARITHGLASPSVVRLGEVVGADLVILANHGETSEDHTSVTEQVLDRARFAVLALHEPGTEAARLELGAAGDRKQVLLVPTDLSPEARAAVDYAFALARELPLEVHLLHVLPAHGKGEATGAGAAEARKQLVALVPEELDGRVFVHVEPGEPGQAIAAAAGRLGASCIMMGEHTRSPLRRWFTHDTSRDVLHHACCPVWFVPGRAA
jgi:nucleotide-binding universal stress UspA family protein